MVRDAVASCTPVTSVIQFHRTSALGAGKIAFTSVKGAVCYFISDKSCFVCWGDRYNTHSFIFS